MNCHSNVGIHFRSDSALGVGIVQRARMRCVVAGPTELQPVRRIAPRRRVTATTATVFGYVRDNRNDCRGNVSPRETRKSADTSRKSESSCCSRVLIALQLSIFLSSWENKTRSLSHRILCENYNTVIDKYHGEDIRFFFLFFI